MKQVTVLGAGQSAPYLIHDLLQHAQQLDLQVTVADRDAEAAASRVVGHERGDSLGFDVGDAEQRLALIERSELVVNLMPPPFQPLIAGDCIARKTPMVSASYRSPELMLLDSEARHEGVTVLCEMGLDPGIDLMTACAIIRRVQDAGGEVQSFHSYGAGLPEPGAEVNPLRYCITWNPRNVVMSSEFGAEYLENGRIRILPWPRVFSSAWQVEVPDLGQFEAYPNRDSLSYRELLGLSGVHTLIRGTLRYPGWCAMWHQIVRLGLPNEHTTVPDLAERSMAELVEMFLPDVKPHEDAEDLRERCARLLGLDPEGTIMSKLDWLGLFSTEPIGPTPDSTPAQAMVKLLRDKLPLPSGVRDMVLLHHELEVAYPEEGGRRERILSTFVDYGEPGGFTGMARGVGMPAAIGARLLLTGQLSLPGCLIPTVPEIYDPVLAELEAAGLSLREETLPLASN